jgi:hypothetical protein
MSNEVRAPGLLAAVDRAEAEAAQLRRLWIANSLETLGIKPDCLAGATTLAEYNPFDTDGDPDFSLLSMRAWMTERMGTVV